MMDPERQLLPSPEEAMATLKQLADLFLQGAGRAGGHVAPTLEADDGGLQEAPPVILVDVAGKIQALGSEAERLFRRKASDVIGSPVEALLGKLQVKGGRSAASLRHYDGTERHLWVTTSNVTLHGVAYKTLTLVDQDVSGAKRTELRYRHLVEQIPAVVFNAALDGGLYDLYVSPQIEELLGYSQTEWVADPVLWYDRLHVDDRRKLDEEFARGCRTGGSFRTDCRFLTKDDRIVWVHGEARLIKDSRGIPLLLQGVAFDITETKRAEEIAQASLREKETLLKEIHHRVKNNLQVTSSLLKLQAEHIEDEAVRRALRDGQNRVRSMALVHELLYRSKDLARVQLDDYIRDLTRQLTRSHSVNPAQIRLENQLAPVAISVDLAVPCGLILNELVSNAIKHAFPEGRRGTVQIDLCSTREHYELAVRDDGIGMPAGVDFAAGSTLGMHLIATLADQIDGELEVRSNGGTEVRLRIPRRQVTP